MPFRPGERIRNNITSQINSAFSIILTMGLWDLISNRQILPTLAPVHHHHSDHHLTVCVFVCVCVARVIVRLTLSAALVHCVQSLAGTLCTIACMYNVHTMYTQYPKNDGWERRCGHSSDKPPTAGFVTRVPYDLWHLL